MKKLYHPKYGFTQGRVSAWISRTRGTTYIGAFWGRFGIYANIPLLECEIVDV